MFFHLRRQFSTHYYVEYNGQEIKQPNHEIEEDNDDEEDDDDDDDDDDDNDDEVDDDRVRWLRTVRVARFRRWPEGLHFYRWYCK